MTATDPGMEVKSQLMDETALCRALLRISHEIVERNKGAQGLILVGICRRGAVLAERIADSIARIEGIAPPCYALDVRGFRDDCPSLPPPSPPSLPFSVQDQRIVLVDDVLYTGRTVRSAIEALFASGRPRAIQLAILIDRGHRELPIRADYVGKNVPTSGKESIRVRIPPFDDACDVLLCSAEQESTKRSSS